MARIGIDVGGTNTDAVAMRGHSVLAAVKVATTANVVDGITEALAAALIAAQISPRDIDAVMIGTTHFTNAVVQRRELAPTAAVRLGLPATAALPPLVDWPGDLVRAIDGRGYLAHGGNEFDGRPIAPLDGAELARIAADIRAARIRSIAITSVFSPVSDAVELRAAALLRDALPDAHITCSSTIGRIGLLERENAAIMNACLRDLATRFIAAVRSAIDRLDIRAPFYLTQNDGTLLDAASAERFPVRTFASGPTNSMRGAAFLSGVADAIVVDIGGTTTDAGALRGGYPRPATMAVEVGGVRTNFRMPELFSVGLGGGSHVIKTGGELAIGPSSVGYRLYEEALVFGGGTLTATDIAVAAGRTEIGDSRRAAALPRAFVMRAMQAIDDVLARCVERARVSNADVPVLVVGGGAVLAPQHIGGCAVTRPPHYAAANAVGAAIAQVSGEVDRVYALAELPREQALADARGRAIDAAIAAGATPTSVRIVDIEDVPLSYLPGNATRIHVRATGDLPSE